MCIPTIYYYVASVHGQTEHMRAPQTHRHTPHGKRMQPKTHDHTARRALHDCVPHNTNAHFGTYAYIIYYTCAAHALHIWYTYSEYYSFTGARARQPIRRSNKYSRTCGRRTDLAFFREWRLCCSWKLIAWSRKAAKPRFHFKFHLNFYCFSHLYAFPLALLTSFCMWLWTVSLRLCWIEVLRGTAWMFGLVLFSKRWLMLNSKRLFRRRRILLLCVVSRMVRFQKVLVQSAAQNSFDYWHSWSRLMKLRYWTVS